MRDFSLALLGMTLAGFLLIHCDDTTYIPAYGVVVDRLHVPGVGENNKPTPGTFTLHVRIGREWASVEVSEPEYERLTNGSSMSLRCQRNGPAYHCVQQ